MAPFSGQNGVSIAPRSLLIGYLPPGKLVCSVWSSAISFLEELQAHNFIALLKGANGFDNVCQEEGSEPRMNGYLVNAPFKLISADSKRTDLALAA